ncbi:molybdate transport system substrate-binding protein [Mucilaginibacter gracilis]|uniref:Molybdate transport system substrate-binding protein n=1 Tax=Mucilaginibacter gracilis TaxID=423350 RepID=A0A495J2B9_9SPHI|nr:molybdate ABC transporter substrate-binding protein [Mucilaginibacter gracilis]RKR82963.1 molybdate transport system substrate-binding protein [Mucilaginibacter gracilis]
MNHKKIFAFTLCIALHISAFSQSLKVAVAANLQSVIKVLDADFKSKTGIAVEPIVGASGNLVAQIKNGAPFDVFLSADMSFPDALYKYGFTTEKPVVYARGILIVCSTENIDVKHWQQLVLKQSVAKVAIANTTTAPYGKAAKEALVKLQLLDKLSPKIVTGESISQVNTYIFNDVVSLGFTSQSFIYDSGQSKKLYYAVVAPKLYAPIEQGVVVLKHGADNYAAEAQKFYKYLLSSSAKAIFKKYGYHTD